jgi:heme-degrading monooxygenase HmoA
MSYIVMNVITVAPERREEFEHRFATRAGKIKHNPGFEAFELMRPADGPMKDRYIVYTRWESEDAFKAWMSSPDFAAGHRQHAEGGPVGTASELWTFDLVEGEYSS